MFETIPDSVLDYVRDVFSTANDKVSKTLSSQPALHEEMLDSVLLTEVAASPPTFFAKDKIAVSIETHWLGGRWMHGRWEIADIAIFITMRKAGRLEVKKVALLQTKRLYSREIPVTELSDSDYEIGIGRLADQTENLFPLIRQRQFSFKGDCVYGAMKKGSVQISNINQYIKKHKIPVYYALYNPTSLPCTSLYPQSSGLPKRRKNNLGCRVMTSDDVNKALLNVVAGKPPTFNELRIPVNKVPRDKFSDHGWRIENFVADEVMRCREGKIFTDSQDENLRALLYGRSAPIASAISITVDVDPDR